MNKVKLGSKSAIYPYPVTILGSMVDGKPSFMTLGFVGVVNLNPSMVSIGVGKGHHTNKGIKQNQTFSINVPSTAMLNKVDYTGLISGSNKDKSQLYECSYGELKTAPLVNECQLNLECKVKQILDFGGMDDIIIGEVVQTYCDESCIQNGNIQAQKIDPIMMSMYENKYFKLGEQIGQCWKSGRDYQPK